MISARQLTAFIIILLALLPASAHPALGQGTQGMLPGPISTRELAGYADRLQLSDQQRQALFALHDEYKNEFRTLRDGEIAAFTKEIRNLYGAEGRMPSRDTIASIIKKTEQLTTRIATLDNRLFDQMIPLLTEEQTISLPRARLARQRERHTGQQMMWAFGNRSVDLSEMILEMKLPAGAISPEADALLVQYEQQLTAGYEKIYERSSRMMLEMFERMENMGLGEASMNDAEAMQKYGEAMQSIWKEVTVKVTEAAAEVHDLNSRTFKRLMPLLPAEHSRPFRSRFYARAYPDAGADYTIVEAAFAAAIKLDGLTPEQRDAVTALRDECLRRLDHITDEMVSVVDKNKRAFNPWDYDSEESRKMHARLGELRTQGQQAAETALKNLNETLGPELAKKMRKLAPDHATALLGPQTAEAMDLEFDALEDDDDDMDDEDDVEVAIAEDDEDEQEDSNLVMGGGDMFLPGPIHDKELAEYLSTLGADDEQRSVAQQFFTQYQEDFAQVNQAAVSAVHRAQQAMWNFDPQTHQARGASPEKIDEVYKLRATALEAIRQADAKLFGDLELVLKPEQLPLLDRVKSARERGMLRRGSQASAWFFAQQSNAPGVDLSTIVRRQRFDAALLKSVDPILVEYEKSVTAPLRERFEAAMDMQRVQEKLSAEMMAHQLQQREQAAEDAAGDGGDAARTTNAFNYMQRYREMLGPAIQRLRDASKAVAALNEQTLQQLATAMSAEQFSPIRSQYNREAHPAVYEDATAMGAKLDAALKLPDLSDQQRAHIAELNAEYRPAYAEFCEKMIAAGEIDPMTLMAGYDEAAMKAYMERQEAVGKLRFDRGELNARAADRVRMILTAEQLQRLGGLPDPEDHDWVDDEW